MLRCLDPLSKIGRFAVAGGSGAFRPNARLTKNNVNIDGIGGLAFFFGFPLQGGALIGRVVLWSAAPHSQHTHNQGFCAKAQCKTMPFLTHTHCALPKATNPKRTGTRSPSLGYLHSPSLSYAAIHVSVFAATYLCSACPAIEFAVHKNK